MRLKIKRIEVVSWKCLLSVSVLLLCRAACLMHIWSRWIGRSLLSIWPSTPSSATWSTSSMNGGNKHKRTCDRPGCSTVANVISLCNLDHLVQSKTPQYDTTHTHTHTHTQPFNGRWSGTTRVGRYQKKLTHSHPSWSSDILYQLPLFTTIHSILCVAVWYNTSCYFNVCLKAHKSRLNLPHGSNS